MSRGRAFPQYRKIYDSLKRQISAGELKKGDKLPFERELCEKFGVERITVRKALSMLVDEHLIVKKPGVGSFVADEDAYGTKHHQAKTLLFLMKKSSNDIRSNSSAFNAQLFFLMEQVCHENGYSLLYLGYTEEIDLANYILENGVSGILLVSTLPDMVYDIVFNTKVAAVCINHINERFVSIMPDNATGIRIAMEHLIGMGHDKIAFIGGAAGAINARERLDSFVSIKQVRSLPQRSDWLFEGDWTYESGKTAINGVLAKESVADLPTAIMAASDMMAIGAMDAIREAGLKIPDDISVVGFDDIGMSGICSPPLTTIQTDPLAMATVAVNELLRILKGNERMGCLYVLRLPVKLCERESVAKI